MKNLVKVNEELLNKTHKIVFQDAEYEARDVLPYAEKEKMAMEIVAATTIFDEKNGCVCRSYAFEPVAMAYALKYYAGIEMDIEDAPDIYATEFKAPEDTWPPVYAGGDDEAIVREMADNIYYAAKNRFEKEQSLEGKLVRLLDGALGDGDIAGAFAKSQAVNHALIDLMKKAQDGEKMQHAPVKGAGGAQIINFAKKEEPEKD